MNVPNRPLTFSEKLRIFWIRRLIAAGNRHQKKATKQIAAGHECNEMAKRHIAILQRKFDGK